MTWPEVTTSAGASTEHAVTGETIIGYAHAGHEAVATTTSLISSATERIDLLDDSPYPFLTQPGVPDLLVSKASQGCLIRIFVASLCKHSAGFARPPPSS